MRKIGHIFLIIISLSLFIGHSHDLILHAYAESEMTTSESCIEFIKKVEGFSSKPYYDYGQHTVGYGTKCPTDKYFDYLAKGITKAEADALLLETITNIEDTIHKRLINKYDLTFTQQQFDALVSFTFNIGSGWMTYDSTLRNALLRNASDNEIVYAFCLYCTAGGVYSSGLIARRLCEVNMFLNGIYSQKQSDALGYVFYEPNGGSLTYQVQGFIYDQTPSPADNAVRNGDTFLGWYTDVNGGSEVTELNKSLSGKTLFARWKSAENPENLDSGSVVIKVTGDVVNIRKGPGTNYGIAKQVYQNDVLLLSHVSDLYGRKWGKVTGGWICLDYTNYNNVLNSNTNVESNKPETDQEANQSQSPPVDTKPAKSGNSGEKTDTISGIVQVNDLLRIRSGPGTAYSTVGYLFNGHQVVIQEQVTAGGMVWGKIARGWISMDYVNTENASTNSTVETSPESTGSEETELNHTEPDQDSTQSPNNAEITGSQGKVIADALRIRSGPDIKNSILGFYYQNNAVVVLEKVLVDSVYWGRTDKGWINMDYVFIESSDADRIPSQQAEEKTVIADCLRVRKETTTNSRIAALLYYGDKVTVLETKTVDGTLWGRVHNGWIHMDYVQ